MSDCESCINHLVCAWESEGETENCQDYYPNYMTEEGSLRYLAGGQGVAAHPDPDPNDEADSP